MLHLCLKISSREISSIVGLKMIGKGLSLEIVNGEITRDE